MELIRCPGQPATVISVRCGGKGNIPHRIMNLAGTQIVTADFADIFSQFPGKELAHSIRAAKDLKGVKSETI